MEVFPEKLVLLEESWRSCVFASYTRRELLSRIVLNKDAAPVFRPRPGLRPPRALTEPHTTLPRPLGAPPRRIG